MYELLNEYDKESFLIINIIVGLWVINASKDIFSLNEPHVYLIDKSKYIRSKIVAYYLFYGFITVFLYGVYQIVKISFYGFRPFDYLILINVLFNLLFIHLLVVILNNRSRNVLFTVILFIVYLLLNGLYFINHWFIDMLLIFIPFLNYSYSLYGYTHIILILINLYIISVYIESMNVEWVVRLKNKNI